MFHYGRSKDATNGATVASLPGTRTLRGAPGLTTSNQEAKRNIIDPEESVA